MKNIYVSDCLSGEKFCYSFEQNIKEITRLNCTLLIEEDENPDTDSDYNVLYDFIYKLKQFPVYIHVIEMIDNPNICNMPNTSYKKYLYTNKHFVTRLDNIKQFKEYFPDIFLDALNGGNVVVSSEKNIELILDEQTNQYKYMFDFSIENQNNNKFYLWVGYDGVGFDFHSNFKAHPFVNMPIVEECDETQ